MLDQKKWPQGITEEELKDIVGKIEEMKKLENRGSYDKPSGQFNQPKRLVATFGSSKGP